MELYVCTLRVTYADVQDDVDRCPREHFWKPRKNLLAVLYIERDVAYFSQRSNLALLGMLSMRL